MASESFSEVAWERGERPSWWTSEMAVWLFKLPDGRGFFTSDLDEACERLLGEPHLREVDAVRQALWGTGHSLDTWQTVGNSSVRVVRKLLWSFVGDYHECATTLQSWADRARLEAEQAYVAVGQRMALRVDLQDGDEIPQEVRDFFDAKPDRYTGANTSGRLTPRRFRQLARRHNAYELELVCQLLIREEDQQKAAARSERQARRAQKAEALQTAEAVKDMREYLAQSDFEPRNTAEQLAVLMHLQVLQAEPDKAEQQRLSEQLNDFIVSDVLRPVATSVDYRAAIANLQRLLE